MTGPVPLRDRITVPDGADLPAPVAGVSWRAAETGDLALVHALLDVAGVVDHPHFTVPIDEVEVFWAAPWVDLTHDAVIGEREGAPVAFAIVELSPTREPRRSVYLQGTVTPDARGAGVGTALLAWQHRRALQVLAALDDTVEGWIEFWVPAENESAIELYGREGMTPARWFTEMRLRGDPPDRPMPVGVRVVEGDGVDPDALRVVKDQVFADHWGSAPEAPERWAARMASPHFRPDLSRIAVDPDDSIAGFVMVTSNPDDWPGTGFSHGYIELVGVRRDRRGSGIAGGLIADAVRAMRAAGLEGAVLDVDSESRTGADRLYAGLGFQPAHQSIIAVEVV